MRFSEKAAVTPGHRLTHCRLFWTAELVTMPTHHTEAEVNRLTLSSVVTAMYSHV
jgi:hypothetical protein